MADMSASFRQLVNKQHQAQYLLAALFEQIFGVPFIKQIYYDNLRAWKDMSQQILEQCEAAGCTPLGSWTYYLAARCKALDVRSKQKV